MDFPQTISFTLTNSCNLRCRMCGQWSEEGYIRGGQKDSARKMSLADWQRLVDEAATHGIKSILLRGGEPFLLPGFIELLDYIHGKGFFVSIDTNGTLLKEHASDLARIRDVHVTVSIDGPEPIHDAVRGVKGCFNKSREGLLALAELEKTSGKKISRSICFTISPYSLPGLDALPGVARKLGVETVVIAPYFYVPEAVGKAYEKELRELGCPAFSWRGFHHEDSGVPVEVFLDKLRRFRAGLQGIREYPYMALSEEEYRRWFTDPTAPVGRISCPNVEKLIDIQPGGEANFCVDFPDYSIGNARNATIWELWNGERARRFRERRRRAPLSACHRCGAKYMSENLGPEGSRGE